jgi:hypothetical protein
MMPASPRDPNFQASETLKRQQQIQQAYSGRRARLDAIKAQEPQYDPSMPASLANMPPAKPVNPNNPPLPKDWKPPVNPNNPVLPQDWAPPGGIPGRAGRDEARANRVGPPAPPGYGGTSGGYHQGTDIPAPPPRVPRSAPIKYPAEQQAPSQRWGTPDPGVQQPQPSAPQTPGRPQAPQPGAQPPGQPQAPYNPLYPSSPTNLPPEGLLPDLSGGQFGAVDSALNLPVGGTQSSYKEAISQLEKSRDLIRNDKRFSPEQRAQAFAKIEERAQELKQSYSEGKQLDSSPTGYDAPPPEQFAEVQQGTGLQSTQDGSFRNPATGDIMPSVVAPNGQRVPGPQNQSEIDSLPPGTRYMDREGKLQMTPAVGGGQGRSASAGTGTQRAAGDSAFTTAEDALAAYEKWSKGQDPASTPSERQVIASAVASIADPNQREALTQMMKNDPEAAVAALQEQGIDLNDELDQARIQDFAKEQNAKVDRSKRLAKAFGIDVPEAKKPALNPERYLVQQGSRGNMQVVRRGSKIAIPLIDGPNGEQIPAPTQMRQLGDLEVDTEFANIVPQENGDELRVLPFSEQTVNLGNFALNDAQRKLFSKETSNIRARPPEEWAKLEDLLQKFQTTDEAWDPENSQAQAQLEEIVGNFYGELDAPGRAMMTMYIAHSLGYKIDKGRGFDSTGWAKNPDKANKPSDRAGANLPTSNMASELGDKLTKTGFLDATASEWDRGLGRSPQYAQGINEMAQNIFTVAQEMEGRTQGGSEQMRREFGNKYRQIDRMVDSLANQNGFGKSLKGRLIVEDLRKRLRSMSEETAPKGATNPSAPARPASRPTASTTPPTSAQPVSRPSASTALPQQDRPMQLQDTGIAATSGNADQAMRSKQRANVATPEPPPDMNWKPEERTWLSTLFGGSNKSDVAQQRLRDEYARLQEQIVKAQDLFDRNPHDFTSGQGPYQAKRDLAEFVRTKGAAFKEATKPRPSGWSVGMPKDRKQ